MRTIKQVETPNFDQKLSVRGRVACWHSRIRAGEMRKIWIVILLSGWPLMSSSFAQQTDNSQNGPAPVAISSNFQPSQNSSRSVAVKPPPGTIEDFGAAIKN